ncbi:hypothetical protein ACOME3_004710 [Neoechinorhynchus agilis]
MPLGRKAKIDSSDDSESSTSEKILGQPVGKSSLITYPKVKGELKHKEVSKVFKANESPKERGERFVVEGVLGKKILVGREMYLQKWHGYPLEQGSWVPIENFDSQELIDQYEVKQNTKRQSYSLRKRWNVYCDERSLKVGSSQEGNEPRKFRLKSEKNTVTLENYSVKDEPHRGGGNDRGLQRSQTGQFENDQFEIVGMKKNENSYQYVVKRSDGRTEFIDSAVASIEFPNKIIDYYESVTIFIPMIYNFDHLNGPL